MSSFCPYRTLGVHKTATQEEIKAAFRQLSKETHPDTGGRTADAERFRLAAQAAKLLTNRKNRSVHDEQVRSQRMEPPSFRRNAEVRRTASVFGPNGVLRPRNLIVLPVALFVTVATIQYAFGVDRDDRKKMILDEQKNNLVQAWKNPRTGHYETPAPWDPVYRKLNPSLEQVPRDLVRRRSR